MEENNNTPQNQQRPRLTVEQRRKLMQKRRQKQMRMRALVIGILALIVILAVILLILLVKTFTSGSRNTPSAGSDAQGTTVTLAPDQTAAPEQQPEATLSPDPLKYTGEAPFQWKMNNPSISDLDSLDTENLGWGIGPAVDDLNRPNDALQYQEKYGKYQAYFIRDDITDKVAYLTFDEGYEYGFTPAILDTLKEKNVKAVFFVTLPFAKENPDLVQRIIDEGHILGNHSVNHPSKGLPSLDSLEDQKAEVMGVHDYIKENFNYDMWLFRYPTGAFSEQSLALLNNMGYASVFWSFAHGDYDVENQPDEAESLEKFINKLHPGAIYLIHAVSQTNTHILGDFIDRGRELGYRFEQFYPLQENSYPETATESPETNTAGENAGDEDGSGSEDGDAGESGGEDGSYDSGSSEEDGGADEDSGYIEDADYEE